MVDLIVITVIQRGVSPIVVHSFIPTIRITDMCPSQEAYKACTDSKTVLNFEFVMSSKQQPSPSASATSGGPPENHCMRNG